MWCEQEHYTFTIVTDVELRECGTLLSNIKLLAGHAHQRITPQAKDYLLKIVQMEQGSLTIAELVERAQAFTPLVVRSCIWHLLYTRELYSDLAKPLNVKTTRISFPMR